MLILYYRYYKTIHLTKKFKSLVTPSAGEDVVSQSLKQYFSKEKIYNHLGKQFGTYNI